MTLNIWHSRNGKIMERVKISVVVTGAEGEEWLAEAQNIFRAVKILLNTIMVDTYRYTVVQTHSVYTNHEL